MMGQDTALAGGRETLLPKLPGGAGTRPEALGPPARSSLMAWPAAWAMAESAARQPFQTPRWRAERRRAPATVRERRLRLRPTARHPPPFGGRKGRQACPGPRQRIGAAERWLIPPHPKEPRKARRLEGWPSARASWFETRLRRSSP